MTALTARVTLHPPSLLRYLAIVLGAFAVGGVAVLATGEDPFEALFLLVGYSFGTARGFFEVVVRAIPLTLAGLGIAVAFRANVWNIGADGQLMIGAIAGFLYVHTLPGTPDWLMLPLFMLCGAAGGAAWGAVAGALKARYNASEIIVTIMLNYIALHMLGWAIRGPLQGDVQNYPRSDDIPQSAMLDVIVAGTRVHEGLLVALAATLLIYLVLRHSALGFQIRAIGVNPEAARYGGVHVGRTVFLTMALSGALAGLAGVGEIAALHHRLHDDFAPGFGVAAIAVALMARLNPLAVPPMALLFGALHVGSGALQRNLGIPFPIVFLIEGVVIVAFLLAGTVRRSREAA